MHIPPAITSTPTPGPWFVRSTGTNGGRRVVAHTPDASYLGGMREILVAEVFGGLPADAQWRQSMDAEAQDLKEANACLIAAAPELLQVVRLFLDVERGHGWSSTTGIEGTLAILARDAVAKAEGR